MLSNIKSFKAKWFQVSLCEKWACVHYGTFLFNFRFSSQWLKLKFKLFQVVSGVYWNNTHASIHLSWIYHRFQISLRLSNFPSARLVRKTSWEEVFSLHGSQIERGFIMTKQRTLINYIQLLTLRSTFVRPVHFLDGYAASAGQTTFQKPTTALV